MAACSSTSTTGADTNSSVPGVTGTTITLGALSALTGTFASGATQQLAGANLYWKGVNAKGGVCQGKTVSIEARDNAYDPQKTVQGYADISGDVLAIQLLTGTAMTQAVQQQMQKDQMSAIPMSWSPDLLGTTSVLVPGTTTTWT